MKKRLWKITMLRFWVTCLASGYKTYFVYLTSSQIFVWLIKIIIFPASWVKFEKPGAFYHLLGKPLSNFPWGRSHYNLQWCAWQRSIRLLCSEQFYEISTNHSSSWAAIMCKHREEAICIPSLYSESLTKTCVTGLK